MQPTAHPPARARSLGRTRLIKGAAAVGVLLWAFGLGVGLHWISTYQSSVGESGRAPASWPQAAALHPVKGSPTLLMFVHPQCSCSRASLSELSALLEKRQRPISAWVIVLKPQGSASSWEQTSLVRQARAIPGVQVVLDEAGAEAARFGARTSGHLVLYGEDGQLQFSGGITGTRGHVGDNRHLQQVINTLAGNGGGQSPFAPVYGCSLANRVPGRT
jgi:hypothetical protein